MELSEREKELVAGGASITANCQPYLQYHLEKALASGADSAEVKAAIEVGKQVRKGASAKMDQFASNLKEPAPVPAGAAGSPCWGGPGRVGETGIRGEPPRVPGTPSVGESDSPLTDLGRLIKLRPVGIFM